MNMNRNLNSNNYTKILAPASSSKEGVKEEPFDPSAMFQPEEKSKAQKRAAKRRKKRQMMQGSYEIPPMLTCNTVENARLRKAVSQKAIQHPMSDEATSSSFDCQDKKPKVENNLETSQGTELRLAIVPLAYPERKLNEKEAHQLKDFVRSRIFNNTDSTSPLFEGTTFIDGALIFNCANEETDRWLRNVTPEIVLEKIYLRALRVEELNKRHRIQVYVEEPTLSVREIINLLGKQNAKLATDKWFLMKGSVNRDAVSIQFDALIEDESLEALKTVSFKPYCGLSRATVTLTLKNRRKNV